MVLKIIVNYYLDRFYGMFQQVYRFRLPPSPLNFIKHAEKSNRSDLAMVYGTVFIIVDTLYWCILMALKII